MRQSLFLSLVTFVGILLNLSCGSKEFINGILDPTRDMKPISGPTNGDVFDNPFKLPVKPAPFLNPSLPTALASHPAPSRDVMDVPEGLTVVGDGRVRPDRKTVVYIHGWSPEGRAERFVAAWKWQDPANAPAKGFNTLVFRWHRDSYAKLPSNAESRIWRSVGEKAVKEYMRLARSLGRNYNKEIRIVGHSLGTQITAYLAYRLHANRFPLRPSRLELLDPYLTNNFLIPKEAFLYSDRYLSKVSEEKTVQYYVHNMLHTLRMSMTKTAIVVYGSMAGFLGEFLGNDRLWTSDGVPYLPSFPETRKNFISQQRVFRGFHYQGMGRGWTRTIDGNGGSRGLQDFIMELFSRLKGQHGAIRDYYFNSIDRATKSPPIRNFSGPIQTAFTARTPTKTIADLPVAIRLIQVAGEKSIPVDDDAYEVAKGISCDRIHAGEIKIYCLAF